MSKFDNKAGILIIKDYEIAMKILKNDSFIVPDLVTFLNKLTSETNTDLSMLQLFASVSPFFVEGKKQVELRKISNSFLGDENYDVWLPFFKNKIKEMIENIKKQEYFDLVEKVSIPLFTDILKPFLGIYSFNIDVFDKKAIVLQKLVEPMLSLNKLKQVNKDLTDLINNLNLDIVLNKEEKSIFKQLLENEYELTIDEKKAYIIVLYAAIAPLAQTIINILVDIYELKEKITSDFFKKNIDYYIWKCVAPIYIHRVSLKDVEINGIKIKRGNTLLIDIASSYKKKDNVSCSHEVKAIPFGHGKHHCLGAFLSKSLISEIVPEILDNLDLKIINKQKDDSNHIANSYRCVQVKNNKTKEKNE